MDNLKEWIEEVLNENGCHLYDLEWITDQGTPLLRVSVEKRRRYNGFGYLCILLRCNWTNA